MYQELKAKIKENREESSWKKHVRSFNDFSNNLDVWKVGLCQGMKQCLQIPTENADNRAGLSSNATSSASRSESDDASSSNSDDASSLQSASFQCNQLPFKNGSALRGHRSSTGHGSSGQSPCTKRKRRRDRASDASAASFRFPCPYCDKSYARADDMAYHQREEHNALPYTCDHRSGELQCGEKFAFNNELIKHQRVHKGTKRRKRIRKDTERSKRVQKTTKLHEESAASKRVSCPFPGCGKTFSRPDLVVCHRRNKHNYMSYACVFQGEVGRCTRTFAYKKELIEHRQHHESFEFPCPHCARTFDSGSALGGHISGAHTKQSTKHKPKRIL